MQHILMIHGNGGSRTRFLPFLDLMKDNDEWEIHIPNLSGFDGRTLPHASNYWDLFIEEIGQAITLPEASWVLYGHGIGGSLLMEWAHRRFVLPDGNKLRPQRVILHGAIGASLHKRLFPALMQPRWVRSLMKKLIAWPALQPQWEKRLFLQPEKIAPDLKQQFFRDYAHCEAFGTFFDLITVSWYREVREDLRDFPFFWYGERKKGSSNPSMSSFGRRIFPIAKWRYFQNGIIFQCWRILWIFARNFSI